ncbi:MAG TPA: type II toxin-antitoxin system PemK/MazF family toxin [Firmicutes bacterium]|nr:type II toxin-antitoxin system PemK/MazF family toxin [Bacillota bacterium]
MVKQGDIIIVSFDPQIGHEQAGRRPALVVSNDFYNANCNLTILCPITNTQRNNPFHVALDSRCSTTGFIMCEQIRTMDLSQRTYRYIEQIPYDILEEVLSILILEISREETDTSN